MQSAFFNGTTQITGVVFAPGTRSVLFIGRQGLGPFCYGEGTDDPRLDGPLTSDGVTIYCYHPVNSYSKGNHAYPYIYQIRACGANDLASVARGQQNPSAIQPYGLWQITFPWAVADAEIKGATYDPVTRRLFVTQAYPDGGDMPLVHVFQLNF